MFWSELVEFLMVSVGQKLALDEDALRRAFDFYDEVLRRNPLTPE